MHRERYTPFRVAVKDTGEGLPVRGPVRYFVANLSPYQAARHNNGCLVSIGLTVPDELRRTTLQRWINAGQARAITHDEWNHMGCQSSCTQRGGKECRW